MTLKEHTRVTVNKAVPRLGLPVGARRAMIHVHGNGEAYDVELVDGNGDTIVVGPFNAADLTHLSFTLECDQEVDGRFLAEVLELPGALAHGKTADEAKENAKTLALRLLSGGSRVTDDFMSWLEDFPVQERKSLKGMFGKPAKTVSVEEMNLAIAVQGAKAGLTPSEES